MWGPCSAPALHTEAALSSESCTRTAMALQNPGREGVAWPLVELAQEVQVDPGASQGSEGVPGADSGFRHMGVVGCGQGLSRH